MRGDGAAPTAGYDEADLLRRARQLRLRAYAPYSQFRVGAVVLTDDGVHDGVNVENASLRLTTCAEQSALAAMVTSGDRGPVRAVAVVGDGDGPCLPCGACRQLIFEHGPEATVYASGDAGRPAIHRIGDLLAHAFGPLRLAQGRADG